METRLPLSALLSQAYVAFAIEFDNEFEHKVPHRTTRYGSSPGIVKAPWLISMALWIRFMRHIPLDGITFDELQSGIAISNKGLTTWLTRLGKWWGYLEIEGIDASSSSKRIGPRATIRPTAGGRRAIEVWQDLIPTIETRWRERFGNSIIDSLANSLKNLANQLDPAVPVHFPVLEYEDQKSRAARLQLSLHEYLLPEGLSKALLAFAADFDARSLASLVVCANSLRVTPDSGISVRDLPRLVSLSVDGVNDVLRQLARERLGTVGTGIAGSRLKVLMLNPKGRLAREGYLPLTEGIEKNWRMGFKQDAVTQLRQSLEAIVQSRDGASSPLLRGLTPYPNGWRARLPMIEGLPHFPMESHRGAFPDGS
jgi:hypothetical protein